MDPARADSRPPYALVCTACGRQYAAGGKYLLDCCADGMLVGEYPPLVVRDRPGMWRFTDWLPVEGPGSAPIGGATYRSEALGEALGLDDLWIAFNGYWPERSANCPTSSFKDLEVAPTLQRLVEADAPAVLVASAGNTGRAFADLGGAIGLPVVVVVAEQHVDRIWRAGAATAPTTKIIGVVDGDYASAVAAVGAAAAETGVPREGGVKNVARRDGVATLLLDAALEIGRIPDHYVQSVGGGPGPIGVGAMANRMVADGRWGRHRMRMHLAQNAVHHPVHRAWQAGRSRLEPSDFPTGEMSAYADVLVNRNPAYELRGGLHDLLVATGGQTYAVDETAATRWRATFEASEGIDIMEAAAVALAALDQAVRGGEIARDECVLLSITGGGVERRGRDAALKGPEAVNYVSPADAAQAVIDAVTALT